MSILDLLGIDSQQIAAAEAGVKDAAEAINRIQSAINMLDAKMDYLLYRLEYAPICGANDEALSLADFLTVRGQRDERHRNSDNTGYGTGTGAID